MLTESIGQIIAAFLGTVGFSVLFHVPQKQYVMCGVTGAVGWLVYLLVHIRFSVSVSSFCATVVIVFLARLFAVWRKVPSNVFMISGIFPIVPGIGIYNTIYDFMTGDVDAGILSGLGTFKAVAAIVLGIVCVFVIPDKWFRSLKFQKKESKR